MTGQKQRLAIARTIIGDCDIIIMVGFNFFCHFFLPESGHSFFCDGGPTLGRIFQCAGPRVGGKNRCEFETTGFGSHSFDHCPQNGSMLFE